MKKQLCFRSGLFALLLVTGMQQINAQYVSCFSGTGEAFSDGGPPVCTSVARFQGPCGIDVDASGNVYVADDWNHRIRKISSGGIVSTLAGYGPGSQDGTGNGALFYRPSDVAVDAYGNVFVADKYNHRIRKITPVGMVTTIAGNTQGYLDGTGTNALFDTPHGIDVDASGNVYVADRGNHRIRKITPTGVVTTIAGSGTAGLVNGTGTAASFNSPADLVVDGSGNLYVTDEGNALIRKITTTGVVSTFAGGGSAAFDGTGVNAVFYNPFGINIDADGNLYVADAGLHRIRKITTAAVVTSFGSLSPGDLNGPLSLARLDHPMGVTVNASGHVLVADSHNNKIKKIDFDAGTFSGYAGTRAVGTTNGPALGASYNLPSGMVYDANGNLYVAEHGSHVIKKITPDGNATIFAGDGTAGSTNGTGIAAKFNLPSGLAIDGSGNLYVADQFNNRIRKITPAGVVTTLAGSTQGDFDGTGVAAKFYYPTGIAIDGAGNLYVTDMNNHRIRKITPAGVVTTFAGSTAGNLDNTGMSARFNTPMGIYFGADGNLYVADRLNHTIRKVTMTAVVTTIAGTGASGGSNGNGTSASFNNPTGITGDGIGNMYITEYTGNRIRKIDATGEVTAIAGAGGPGNADGYGTAAQFAGPYLITMTSGGDLIVSDRANHRLRKITLIPTSVLNPSKSLGEVLVYPNPVRDILHIEAGNQAEQYYIMNSMGEVVAEQSLDEEATIDVSALPHGIYVLKIVSEQGYRTQKFIKE